MDETQALAEARWILDERERARELEEREEFEECDDVFDEIRRAALDLIAAYFGPKLGGEYAPKEETHG